MTYIDNGYDNLLNINTLDTWQITSVNSSKELAQGAVDFKETTMAKLKVGQDMQSWDYVSWISGWKIWWNWNAEFNDGTFRGALTSSTIDIPNSSSPLFSVDASWNVVANNITIGSLSFKRFTIMPWLESLDGWATSIVGTGASITPKVWSVYLVGWNTIGDITRMSADSAVAISTTYNPRFQFHGILSFETVPVGDTIIGFWSLSPFWGGTIGFKRLASGNTLHAITPTSSQLISWIATDVFHSYRIVVENAGAEIYFYIDEVLKATLSYTALDSDIGITIAVKSQTATNDHTALIWGLFFSQDF